MKFLLAVLLSFVITEAPVLARYEYTLPGSAITLQGTYAGVMIPTSDQLLVANANDFGSNAMGLFTLSLPSSGLGGGTVVIFSSGDTYTGSIQALANPDPTSNGVLGVVDATFNYTYYPAQTGTAAVTAESVTADAQGSFDATAVSDAYSVGGLGVDLDGTSVLSIDHGFVSGTDGQPIIAEVVTFAISGFEQSQTASSVSGT